MTVLAWLGTWPVLGQGEALRIGPDLQLFVDGYLIESMKGVRLKLHQPVAAGRAIAFDQAWEGNVSAYAKVFQDGEKFRMYYRGASDPAYVRAEALRPGEKVVPQHVEVACYAESGDGITWRKPELGLHEFQGTRKNNIVWAGEGAHNFAPFRDDNPGAAAGERYKAVGTVKGGLGAFRSADGLRWEKLREAPIITDGAFDSLNVVFWDARRRVYVAVYRDFRQGIRTMKCATSGDFVTWTPGEWADYGDAPAEHLYTNATTPYFRAPQIYLAFPKRFVPWRKPFEDSAAAGVSDAVFMSSRDGVHWDRRFLEAFVRPGRDRRDWVHRNRLTAAGVAATGADEISIYVSRHYTYASAHLERMTLRMDGFVSVHADYAGGELVTKPLYIEGSSLVLNYATSAAGSIRYEILDMNGRPLAGYGLEETRVLFGDQIAEVIPLQSPKRRAGRGLEARPVRLRFVMKDADLYSLQIRD
ncbi:MAG: hypothetical protein FJW34_13320 [Acidobacteria bacterium]|nr:hypothetical protein [Acidobacteriota bacterium]